MEEFIAFIDKTIDMLKAEEKLLVDGHRKDEANLVRVKMNIYDVCKTVYGVCSRMPSKKVTDKEEMQTVGKWQGVARCDIVQELRGDVPTDGLYLKKLEAISANWKDSYEKAKAHGDVEKQVIEENKLAVVEEVKAKFLELSR